MARVREGGAGHHACIPVSLPALLDRKSASRIHRNDLVKERVWSQLVLTFLASLWSRSTALGREPLLSGSFGGPAGPATVPLLSSSLVFFVLSLGPCDSVLADSGGRTTGPNPSLINRIRPLSVSRGAWQTVAQVSRRSLGARKVGSHIA